MNHQNQALAFFALATVGAAQFVPTSPPSLGLVAAYDSVRSVAVTHGGGRFGSATIGRAPETWEWDGSWVDRSALVAPDAPNAGLAFDASRGETVLFGDDLGSRAGDTWVFDGSSWSRRMPMQRPSIRSQPAMAFDANRGRVLLFGGLQSGVPLNDTWEWNGTNWALRSPAASPPALPSAVAYDAQRGLTMLVNQLGETWQWDGMNWSQRASLPGQMPRFVDVRSGLAYDAAHDRTVFVADSATRTYEWDGASWTVVLAGPFQSGRLIYDEARGRVAMLGGVVASPFGQEIGIDVLLWDGAAWTRAERSLPAATHKHAMAYHAATQEVVSFGGAGRGFLALDPTATWRWNGSDWGRRPTATVSPERLDHAIAPDANGNLVMFGGRGPGGARADTWIWDGTDWSPRTPAQSPSPRSDHAMAYDSLRGEVVLFGGERSLNDTWIWNGTDWQLRSPAQSPPALADPDMVYDAARDRMVLVAQQGVWEWDGSTWTPVSGAGVADPVLGYDPVSGKVYGWSRREMSVFCDGEFRRATTIAAFPPSSNVDSAMAYHAATGQFVVFGAAFKGSSNPALFAYNELFLYRPAGTIAEVEEFGAGCIGSGGRLPTLARNAQSWPVVGRAFELVLDGLPARAASFAAIGFTPVAPVDLAAIGMPGCPLLVRPVVVRALPLAASSQPASTLLSLSSPPQSGMVGLRFEVQGIVVDPVANALGLTTTNAVAARFGTF